MSPGSGCGGTVFHRPGTKRMGPFSAVRGCTTKLTEMSSAVHPHVERLPEVRVRVNGLAPKAGAAIVRGPRR